MDAVQHSCWLNLLKSRTSKDSSRQYLVPCRMLFRSIGVKMSVHPTVSTAVSRCSMSACADTMVFSPFATVRTAPRSKIMRTAPACCAARAVPLWDFIRRPGQPRGAPGGGRLAPGPGRTRSRAGGTVPAPRAPPDRGAAAALSGGGGVPGDVYQKCHYRTHNNAPAPARPRGGGPGRRAQKLSG